ncbi:MAG TPA: hypothetical protein VMD09_15875 [Solirubrobacteraceae bacterium]|nr:hypothetical protein [Solirubrobacteraceae bacterium]
MSNFTDHLWTDLVREHGPTLAQVDRPKPGPARVLRRPPVLAGGTLALAGVGAALVLALGGPAATPAFAITTNSDGVLLKLNINSSLPQANAKLASMGIHEAIGIQMASGPATVSGPVTCTPQAGVTGPPVKVLDGPNGTEVISPGQTGGNTGVGTWHLASCSVFSSTGETSAGNSGNSGNPAATVIAEPSTKPVPGGTAVPVAPAGSVSSGPSGNSGNTGGG